MPANKRRRTQNEGVPALQVQERQAIAEAIENVATAQLEKAVGVLKKLQFDNMVQAIAKMALPLLPIEMTGGVFEVFCAMLEERLRKTLSGNAYVQQHQVSSCIRAWADLHISSEELMKLERDLLKVWKFDDKFRADGSTILTMEMEGTLKAMREARREASEQVNRQSAERPAVAEVVEAAVAGVDEAAVGEATAAERPAVAAAEATIAGEAQAVEAAVAAAGEAGVGEAAVAAAGEAGVGEATVSAEPAIAEAVETGEMEVGDAEVAAEAEETV